MAHCVNVFSAFLSRYGVVAPKKINSRLSLYPKAQVDGYRVEGRGEKSGRARQAKAKGGGWGYQQSRVASALGFFVMDRRVVAAQKLSFSEIQILSFAALEWYKF